MKHLFWIVLRKELREALRDLRSIALPLSFAVIMPAIIYGSLTVVINKATEGETEEIVLLVHRSAQAPTLMAQLKQAGITIEPSTLTGDEEITKKLESNKISALLSLDADYQADFNALRPAKMTLWINTGTEQNAKIRKIKDHLRQYQNTVLSWRMVARGIAPVLLQPVKLQEYDVASQGSRAKLLGGLFTMLFWSVFMYSSAAIIDATAGERERRTLELLMAQPVAAAQVVIGKWLTGAVIGMVGVILQFSVLHAVLTHMPLEEIGLSWQMGLGGLLQVIVSCLPLAMLGAAMQMAFAMNTKTFKEAQSTVSIVMIVPMVPAVALPMLDLGSQSWMYALPMIGNSELLKALAGGKSPSPVEYAMLYGVPLALTVGLVWFCAYRMRSERFVIGV
jgi:sodium transport system permease protein